MGVEKLEGITRFTGQHVAMSLEVTSAMTGDTKQMPLSEDTLRDIFTGGNNCGIVVCETKSGAQELFLRMNGMLIALRVPGQDVTSKGAAHAFFGALIKGIEGPLTDDLAELRCSESNSPLQNAVVRALDYSEKMGALTVPHGMDATLHKQVFTLMVLLEARSLGPQGKLDPLFAVLPALKLFWDKEHQSAKAVVEPRSKTEEKGLGSLIRRTFSGPKVAALPEISKTDIAKVLQDRGIIRVVGEKAPGSSSEIKQDTKMDQKEILTRLKTDKAKVLRGTQPGNIEDILKEYSNYYVDYGTVPYYYLGNLLGLAGPRIDFIPGSLEDQTLDDIVLLLDEFMIAVGHRVRYHVEELEEYVDEGTYNYKQIYDIIEDDKEAMKYVGTYFYPTEGEGGILLSKGNDMSNVFKLINICKHLVRVRKVRLMRMTK